MLIYNNHTNSTNTISVKQNTSKIISSSEDFWGGIGNGCYIKIGESDILYPILKSSKIFYLKDFEVVNSKQIKIKEDIGIDLQLNDIINIIIDEFELNSLTNIVDSGRFFKVDDTLTITGGEVSIDISTGISRPTKFKIEEVGPLGEIIKLSCIDYGLYISPPKEYSFVTNGNGVNAKLNLVFHQVSNKKIIKRTIKEILINTLESLIKLDYSLPPGLSDGKLSLEKWEIQLSSLYLENTKINTNYKIIKDFTPNIKLPLMVKNTLSADIVYNNSVQIIDNEIALLKQEINKLKELLNSKN